MTKTDVKPTSVRLPEDLKAAIEHLAAQDDRSVSKYIERVLDEHVRSKAPKLMKLKKGL